MPFSRYRMSSHMYLNLLRAARSASPSALAYGVQCITAVPWATTEFGDSTSTWNHCGPVLPTR